MAAPSGLTKMTKLCCHAQTGGPVGLIEETNMKEVDGFVGERAGVKVIVVQVPGSGRSGREMLEMAGNIIRAEQ